MKLIHPIALFRLQVIGPLISRGSLSRGELKAIIRELAEQHYDIPHSRHTRLSAKTIEFWYYLWKKGNVDALAPKKRSDRGASKIPEPLQLTIIEAKKDNPKRSINTLMQWVRLQQFEGAEQLSRSSVYRLLLQHNLSRPAEMPQARELRRFEADYPGDIIYGDVMHGPKVVIDNKMRKSYLVTLMDDKSRLILHSEFCTGETALDIEHVLKQSLLRRGLPKRLVIDNGAAYRSRSLQGICARLSIQLIYCRPYAPEGKGKLERWHKTLRDQFLTELPENPLSTLTQINSLLWAWIDQLYHSQPHAGLAGKTPLSVWQNYLQHVTPLGHFAHRLDELFYHRIKRKVRKDGTISYAGKLFEVPYCLSGKTAFLVIEPHQQQALFVETEEGERLGEVTPLNLQANRHYKRAKSTEQQATSSGKKTKGMLEIAMAKQQDELSIAPQSHKISKKKKGE